MAVAPSSRGVRGELLAHLHAAPLASTQDVTLAARFAAHYARYRERIAAAGAFAALSSCAPKDENFSPSALWPTGWRIGMDLYQ